MSIASRINEMTEHLRNDWNGIDKLGLKAKKIPDEYTQVDYIESSGTQYIDTGVNADSNLRVVLDMSYSVSPVNMHMGAIYNHGSGWYTRYHFDAFNGQWRGYYDTLPYSFGTSDLNRHIFDFDAPNKVYKVDDISSQTFSYTSFNTRLNYWLFGRNSNDSSLQFFNTSKLYSCEMCYNNVLVRNFVPCYRNSDNKVGLYDLVNNVFYANQGTGEFTYGEVQEEIPNKNIKNIAPVLDTFYNQVSDKTDLAKNGVVGRTTQNHTIPVEYTRVDYIESSGTQYIDTGVKANQDTITDVTLKINQFTQDYNVYFGSCYQFSSQAYELMSVYRPNYGIDPSIANTYNNGYVYTDIISTNTKYNIRKEKNVAYLDGNIVAEQEYAEFETPVNMYIFATNSNGNANYKSSIKLYKMTISDGTNIIRNFIPCYRNSDNVVGLYDLVNDVFYSNQGTGTFTYGTVIVEPSPDYPLETNNLSGDVEYKVRGKNLFDGVFRQGNHVSTRTANRICSNNAIQSKSGNYYTLSTNLPNTYKWKIMNCTANGTSTTVVNDTNYTSSGSVSVNCTINGYLKVLIGKTDDSNLTPSDVSSYWFQIEKGSTTTPYEPYISESFPLSLKSRNLFDKDNVNVISAYISGSRVIASATVDKLIYIPCKPNTTYSLQKMPQETTNYNRFRIGTTTDTPALRMTVEDYFNAGDGSALTNKTITTGANANYLVFYCYREDTLTSFEDMLSSIQIEEVDNLFDKDNANVLDGAFINATAKQIGSNASAKCLFIEIESNTPYVISKSKGNRFAIGTSSKLPKIGISLSHILDDKTKTSFEITSASDAKYLTIYFTISPDEDSLEDILSSIQVYKNVGPSDYEPYYDINLCNISDYKDRIYSQNGEFYLEKKTDKVVLNGSGITGKISYPKIGTLFRFKDIAVSVADIPPVSNYFIGVSNSSNRYNGTVYYNYDNSTFDILTTKFTTITEFKSWLSTHNTELQFPIPTPITTKITQENYPTLYSQLLAIQEFLTKYKINKEFLLDYSSPEIEY